MAVSTARWCSADHPPRHRDLSAVTELRECKTCRFVKEGTMSYTFFATDEQKSMTMKRLRLGHEIDNDQ